MLLRIEDTDRTRLVEGSVDNLLQVFASVGIMPDEGPNNPWNLGPYFQSERLELYHTYVKELLEKDMAYYCFCSSQRLDELRAEQESLKLPTKYDGKCRYLSKEEVEANLKAGLPYTIRLKVPKDENIVFEDIVRGRIEINTKDIDDQVLIKSDGFPTYHMAVVVDDHAMGVTHVIRGEEWISSTPKHILLYDAFGWTPPAHAHLPSLLGKDKKKLSKRTGDVSVESYLEKGYITEAILNYIALLGWNPKTTEEFFTLNELTERFDLTQVHKAGAVFDIERLDWFSSKYIQNMTEEELYNRLVTYLKRYDRETLDKIEQREPEYTYKILKELKIRLRKFNEFKELSSFFYGEITPNPELCINPKMGIENNETIRHSIELGLEIIAKKENDYGSIEEIKTEFIEEIQKKGMKNGQVLWPIRAALSGEMSSPWAFECIYILWIKKSTQRLEQILKLLK